MLAACREALRRLPAGHAAGWFTSVGLLTLLGIGSHSARDHWGVAHICLQPLVLAGLACLASCWSKLAPALRQLFVIGAAFDLLFGILLHYAVQGFLIDRWLTPDRPLEEVVRSFNFIAVDNYMVKSGVDWRFVGDAFSGIQAVPIAVALFTLALAIRNIRSQPDRIDQPSTDISL